MTHRNSQHSSILIRFQYLQSTERQIFGRIQIHAFNGGNVRRIQIQQLPHGRPGNQTTILIEYIGCGRMSSG